MPPSDVSPTDTLSLPHGRAPGASAASPVAADAVESFPQLIACEECDLVYERQHLECDQIARCPRCQSVVQRGHRLGLEGQLALTAAAFVVFVLANSFPIITLDLRGVRTAATMLDALRETWLLEQRLVAVIAAVTAVVAPLFVVLLRGYVGGALFAGFVPPGFGYAMHVLRIAARWSMVEVFLLGTLVSIVRVAGLANVIPGVGIFSFGALTLLLASIEAAGMHGLWARAQAIRLGGGR